MANSIGQTIRKLRKERNLTQEELAEQLNVTSQAVSKWENETGMPDISQIIPLASVFNVSTDVLFGIEGTTSDKEALKIIQKSHSMREYGKLDTYLASYDELMEGLKKYPSNLMLLNNCVTLGLTLSLPENGWLCASERAEEIAAETIRQAQLIISHSKNISDIMAAHQALVYIYSANGNYDKAMSEAQNFPVRTDMTMFSNMARITECMGDHARTTSCLCSELDYSLQALEDNIVRLGKVYYNRKKYKEAVEVYETFIDIMKTFFKDSCPPPYHDFDSGDCYLLLAQAYLALGNTDKAMDNVENSISYYLNLIKTYGDDKITRQMLMKPALLKESELTSSICKSTLKERLCEKLSTAELKPLCENKRFRELYKTVNSLEL